MDIWLYTVKKFCVLNSLMKKLVVIKMQKEDDIDNEDNDYKEIPDLGGASSLRSMLLRHQLNQKVRAMHFENAGNAYFLASQSHEEFKDYEKVLNRLLKFTPYQPIGNPPISRNEQTKDIRILRKKNAIKYRYTFPFFMTAYKITKNIFFRYFISVLLFINICTSVYLTSSDEEETPLTFQIFHNFEFAVTVIYLVEIVLKIIAKGVKRFFSDIHLIIDFLLFLISIVPPGFIILYSTANNHDIAEVIEQIKPIYILNAMRVFRLVTRTKSLLRITKALLRPYKKFLFVSLLILVIMYIFAIFGIHLFYAFTVSDNEDFEFRYKFSSFTDSLATVFQILTFDCWMAMCREISKVCSPVVTILYFVVWVWIGGFVFTNIFVGVLVDQFKQETENMAEKRVNERMAKYTIRARKKHAKVAGSAHKYNPQLQLSGEEISKKVGQIYSQFESYEMDEIKKPNDENSKKEICSLLKHMGYHFETVWTNSELFEYVKTLCQISDNIAEIETLDKKATNSIHSYLKYKT